MMKKSQMKKTTRRPRRRAPARRRGGGLVKGEVAQVSTTLPDALIYANTPYAIRNIALTNSNRAVQVARAYQYYRIRKVWFKFKPIYDTYAATTGSSANVPYLFYCVDKDGTFPASTSTATMRSAGAKPIRFDDKTITRTIVPQALMQAVSAGAGPGAPLVQQAGKGVRSPWLSTNANAYNSDPGAAWVANSIDHLGIVYGVDQANQPTSPGAIGLLEVIIEYEFKKPLWTLGTGDVSLTHVDLDALENPPVLESKPPE